MSKTYYVIVDEREWNTGPSSISETSVKESKPVWVEGKYFSLREA